MTTDFIPTLNDYREMLSIFGAMAREFPFFDGLLMKWEWADLVPGLSDIDSRMVCDSPTAEQWLELDRCCGQWHLEILQEHPSWARIMEHLPGACVCRNEILSQQTSVADQLQWTMVYGDDAFSRGVTGPMWRTLAANEWNEFEEVLHVGRFLKYFGPYDRNIDPPINLGASEFKYPLHSRCWHYFAPAIVSAMSVIENRTLKGKRVALGEAMHSFPDQVVLREVENLATSAYSAAENWNDDQLSYLEDAMLDCLKAMLPRLVDSVRFALPPIPLGEDPTPEWGSSWKESLKKHRSSPGSMMLHGLRFLRVVSGRYWFYRNAPDFFDAELLMQRELTNVRTWRLGPFLEGVLSSLDLDISIQEGLDGPMCDVLDADTIDVCKRLLDISYMEPKPSGEALWSITDELIALVRYVYPPLADYFCRFSD